MDESTEYIINYIKVYIFNDKYARKKVKNV